MKRWRNDNNRMKYHFVPPRPGYAGRKRDKMKKFELTTESIKVSKPYGAPDKTLFRIRALTNFGDVKAGDLGVYVEKIDNIDTDI